MRKPIICLIQLLKCWWFAVNFRWRSSPILFRFCRLSLPWYTLVNCIVGDFNDNCCRSLKIAKRFSIANNCKKTKQIKRTWNKNRHEKKNEEQNSREQRKTKFETVYNTRRRSSPILFRFCTLFSCIIGFFNDICCRSLLKKKTNQKNTK